MADSFVLMKSSSLSVQITASNIFTSITEDSSSTVRVHPTNQPYSAIFPGLDRKSSKDAQDFLTQATQLYTYPETSPSRCSGATPTRCLNLLSWFLSMCKSALFRVAPERQSSTASCVLILLFSRTKQWHTLYRISQSAENFSSSKCKDTQASEADSD